MSDLCLNCEMSMRCLMGRPPANAKLCRTCLGVWDDDTSTTVRCNVFLHMLRRAPAAHTFYGLAVKGTLDKCGVCWGIKEAHLVEGYLDGYGRATRYEGAWLPQGNKPKVLG